MGELVETTSEDGSQLSPVLQDGIKNYLIDIDGTVGEDIPNDCLLYTSPSPRDS